MCLSKRRLEELAASIHRPMNEDDIDSVRCILEELKLSDLQDLLLKFGLIAARDVGPRLDENSSRYTDWYDLGWNDCYKEMRDLEV